MVLVLVPPLRASICERCRGVVSTNLSVALVRLGPSKLILLVVKAPYGPDRNQPLEPQSTIALGYWPVRGRFGLARSSKITVRVPAQGVGLDVGLGVAVGVRVGPGVWV